jgi:hypothetical protein
MTRILTIVLSTIFGVVSASAYAVPIFSNSAVVVNVTNTATFDGISGSLLNYTEDGIVVSVNDNQFSGYPDVHYGSGGNNEWVTISLVSGDPIKALDFLLGNGNGGPFGAAPTDFLWETFVGVTSTGFGSLNLERGTTVGWTDLSGFTSIRVAALASNLNAFGDYQAIALDDVRIDSTERIVVSAPTSAAFIVLSLAGLGFAWRKKA